MNLPTLVAGCNWSMAAHRLPTVPCTRGCANRGASDNQHTCAPVCNTDQFRLSRAYHRWR